MSANPQSGLLHPRFLLAFFLCSGGVLLALASFAASPLSGKGQTAAMSKIAPWVLERTANGQQAEFLIVLADQADVKNAAALRTRVEKGRYVRDELWNRAQATQGPLLQWLRARQIEHRSFYIVNMIWVRADSDVALALAARPDVLRVEGNPQIRNIPDPLPAAEMPARPESVTAIEPGITDTRAPEVWALGYTGQGIVVAGADTGYRWQHEALKNQYRGWDGSTANHDYNWHDSIHSGGGSCGADSDFPCDDQGHGTHTMGTAIGDDGGSNRIGMAPGAKWIGCRNMNVGVGTPATYIECMEFFLAPYPLGGTPAQGDPDLGPDVTNNSWGCPPSEGCSTGSLQAAVEAQRAAGIMMVVSAGNGGSACSTVADPPGIYDAVYSIGALNTGTDVIASFSSRGPVDVDGSNRRKPDLCAPGTNTRSSTRTSSTSYGNFSGTSMASPHVAGAVALLWSAQPTLRNDVSLTETILNETAFHIPSPVPGCDAPGATPNNTYGHGRLDIKTAVDRATASGGNQPNLAPFQPAGWSDKIVVSNVSGTNTDTTNLIPSDTLYVDWAVLNGGSASINASFTVELYVDDVFRAFWTASSPINVAGEVAVEDYILGSLSIGTHTLRIKSDATNSVAETNEADNESTKTITIFGQRSYTITTSSSPSNGGFITNPLDPDLPVNGTFAAGTLHRVTATSAVGFVFFNWTENGNVVSTGHSYTFTLNNNRNLVANFNATPTPVPTPTITISSSPAVVNEGGSAAFTIFASTINPSQSVTVNYGMSSKALNGVDYTLSGIFGQITIPPGASSAAVTLNALSDNLNEKKEKAIMTLQPGAGYELPKKKRAHSHGGQRPAKATVTIANVQPTPTPAPPP